jgi:8-oxo-dGTP diphosphatase
MPNKTKMHSYEYPHPAVTVDIVVFTIRDQQLKLLLIRRAYPPYRGKWALPGGFVDIDEGLDEAAIRELREETGVSSVYLEQLYTFGKPKRDPRERVITVAYYALIPSDKMQLQAATDAEAVGWFGMNELPGLAFDHAEIVSMAQRRLVAKLGYSTLAFQFLPEAFTLHELQDIYEIICQQTVDKRNFRKWVLGLDQIEETGGKRTGSAHRPAKLYRKKYPDKVEIIK